MLRIIPDHGQGDEIFIPMDISNRSIAVLDRTIEAYKSGEIARIAARHLAAEGIEVVEAEDDHQDH